LGLLDNKFLVTLTGEVSGDASGEVSGDASGEVLWRRLRRGSLATLLDEVSGDAESVS
jgi:hypothetical protein